MASLFVAAGLGIYAKVKDTRDKKRAARDAHNESRFSELEKEYAAQQLRQPPNLATTERGESGAGERRGIGFGSNNPYNRDSVDAPSDRRGRNGSEESLGSREDLAYAERSKSAEERERRQYIKSGVVRGSVGGGGDEDRRGQEKRRMWKRGKGFGELKGGAGDDGVIR